MTTWIRAAVLEDLPAMAAIEQSVFAATAWTLQQLADELGRDTRRYLVACDGTGAVVGYAGLFLSVPDADIQTVAVAGTAQGQGIGRRLLRALIEQAWALGCTRMFLEVHAGNAAALRIYEDEGFLRLGRRSRYYPDGGDAVTMRLRRHEVPAVAEAGRG